MNLPFRGRHPATQLWRDVIPNLHRFLRTEVWAPEKLPGNINVLTGITLFLGGIAAVRTWGELMIPA
jgi:hypothetical protein